jgi:hypothetical protein
MKLLPTILLVVLWMLSALEPEAQEVFLCGSRYQALADASVGLSGCWSVFGNQAGLIGIKQPEIAGSFQNRFLVDELSTRSGLLAIPVHSSVFAVSLYQFGKIPFRQEKFGFAYSQRISPSLNFGMQFNYYQLFLSEDNRSAGATGLELGVQYHLSDRLVFGFHILNPYQTRIKVMSGSYNYPSRIDIGALYHLSECLRISSEIEKDVSRHLSIKTGIEYVILEMFYIRAGISSNPHQLSAGIGFPVKKLTIDMATTYNQYLGNSPSVSFQYQF